MDRYRVDGIFWDDTGITSVDSGELGSACPPPTADVQFIGYINVIVLTVTSPRERLTPDNLTEYTLWTWDKTIAEKAADDWNENFFEGKVYRIPPRDSEAEGYYPDAHLVCTGTDKDSMFDSRRGIVPSEAACDSGDFWDWNIYQEGGCTVNSGFSRIIPLTEWLSHPGQYFSGSSASCSRVPGTECVGVSHGELYSVTAVPEYDGHVKTTVKTFSFEIVIVQEVPPSPPPPPLPPSPPPPPPLPPSPPPGPRAVSTRTAFATCKVLYVSFIVVNFLVSVI
jgi:hypothetical protein